MPQSLSLVIVHLVFSTKDRASYFSPAIRPELFAYLSEVSRNSGCDCYGVGGMPDHIHMAVRLSRTLTIAALVQELKVSSSAWLKTKGRNLADFAWQRGYGAFSVAPRDLDSVVTYIDRQEEHHRTRTFQEEYRAFLTKYGIDYDERYVWD